MPGINQRSDAKKGSSAFQKHDGKKFGDEGFMDTHFPSGAKRSAMKNITGVTHVHDDGSVHGPKKEHRPLEKPPTKMYGKKSPAKAHKEGHGERIGTPPPKSETRAKNLDAYKKSRPMTSEMKPTKRFKPLKPTNIPANSPQRPVTSAARFYHTRRMRPQVISKKIDSITHVSALFGDLPLIDHDRLLDPAEAPVEVEN